MRAVLRSSYREVQVQIPLRLSRRPHARVHRLPRAAQRRARAVQGRRPLPPGGRPRRGARAGDADDAGRPRSPASRSAAPRAASTSTRRSCTSAELQAITRSFIDKIEKVLGPTRDIPAPDVGTNAQMMAWMMDEYGKLHGHTPAIVTGKPIALEGSYGREAATGRGVVYMFREAARQLGLTPADTRVVVQGFGNVGAWAARHHRRSSAATDRRRLGRHGAVHAEAGLDPHALQRPRARGRQAGRVRPRRRRGDLARRSCWGSSATCSSRPRSAG